MDLKDKGEVSFWLVATTDPRTVFKYGEMDFNITIDFTRTWN